MLLSVAQQIAPRYPWTLGLQRRVATPLPWTTAFRHWGQRGVGLRGYGGDITDLDLILSLMHVNHGIIMFGLCVVELLCSLVLATGSLVGLLYIAVMTSFVFLGQSMLALFALARS